MDEDGDDIVSVLKDVIGGAAYDNAGFFVRKVSYNLGLIVKEVFLGIKVFVRRRKNFSAVILLFKAAKETLGLLVGTCE